MFHRIIRSQPLPDNYRAQQQEKLKRLRIFCTMCGEFHNFRRSEGAEYDPRKLDNEFES